MNASSFWYKAEPFRSGRRFITLCDRWWCGLDIFFFGPIFSGLRAVRLFLQVFSQAAASFDGQKSSLFDVGNNSFLLQESCGAPTRWTPNVVVVYQSRNKMRGEDKRLWSCQVTSHSSTGCTWNGPKNLFKKILVFLVALLPIYCSLWPSWNRPLASSSFLSLLANNSWLLQDETACASFWFWWTEAPLVGPPVL